MTNESELRQKTIALVGLMGAGKSTIGKKLAERLGLPFRDADAEIELAAGSSISEIFAKFGEHEFRAGEQRVIARLLNEPAHVMATGGGALTNPETRALLKGRAITVWLKADLELLARRVARRDTRPLLRGKDPMMVLKSQAEARYPYYAEADVTVEVGEGSHASSAELVVEQLKAFVAGMR